MLGWGNAREVRPFATVGSLRSRDVGPSRRYVAALYRHTLLTRDGPALAELVAGDVIVDQSALAPTPKRARYRLTESILRRCHQLTVGPAWRVRRPGQ
jgi:hypothetical protein